jgi:multimeric flavodoxin WrbA
MAIVLVGTARNDSNTLKAVRELSLFKDAEVIQLHELTVDPYCYDHRESRDSDDFLKIVHRLIAADTIVFATPVYWYAMSGTMKTFFDRLTDLITTSKSLGRSLAGKLTFLLATGSDADLPEGFEVPFKRTSEYFGMSYKGSYYFQMTD